MDKDNYKLLARITSISGLFLLVSGIYIAFYMNLGLNIESDTLIIVGVVLFLIGIYYFGKAYSKTFKDTVEALQPDYNQGSMGFSLEQRESMKKKARPRKGKRKENQEQLINIKKYPTACVL